jgi:glycine oxidase
VNLFFSRYSVINSKLIKTDYIIVGQGLAGTLLAYNFMSKGQKVIIIDNNTEGASSKIAAGVINPVTGRRIVKSWRIDEVLPFAFQHYQDIENQHDINIFNDYTILRTFKNAADENEWLLRSQWDEYKPYCAFKADPSVFEAKIKPFYGYGEIQKAAQIDVPFLIDFFQKKWLSEGILVHDVMDYNALILNDESITYKDFEASKIIFCEGARGAQNAFFDWLPFNIDKGELLIVKIPNADFNKIFKNNISIVPLREKDLYWVGATNEWNSPNDLPTEAKKQLIINELEEILTIPFEVIDHKAAFRPTVKDRRPFIGFHPVFPQMLIFNGFGTKGASLIPFWANHLVEVLLYEMTLDNEVNINRFL